MNATPPQQPPRAGQPGGAPRGRPGAMTMAMQAVPLPQSGPKVLRIGLIQGGKIVEERIIRKRETVSVGSSEKNHFVVQAEGIPARFELFQLVGNDYILNFTDKMRGKVGLPGGVKELDELRTTGAARNAGSYFQVKLTDTSRGKVVLGDITLLFQFVVAPPVQPRPQLPAAARGGFVKGIDWVFTAFVVFSFMAHFGLVIYLENADWPMEQGIAAIPESMARLVFSEPPPPPEPEPEASASPTENNTATEPTPSKVPERNTQQQQHASSSADENTGSRDASNAEARARMTQEAAAAAETLLVGALGESGGALADVLAGGAVTGNAAEVLAQASGTDVAAGGAGGQLRTRGGGGTGSGQGGLGGLARAGGDAANQARDEGTQVVERVIRGRINLQEGDGDMGGSGDFDPQVVVRTIRTRLRAIQSCYEQRLRQNPTLAGKVTVQFTIEQSGTVSAARATENSTGDDGVAECVVGTVRRFRFNPGPEGGSVQFSYPFVFAPQS